MPYARGKLGRFLDLQYRAAPWNYAAEAKYGRKLPTKSADCKNHPSRFPARRQFANVFYLLTVLYRQSADRLRVTYAIIRPCNICRHRLDESHGEILAAINDVHEAPTNSHTRDFEVALTPLRQVSCVKERPGVSSDSGTNFRPDKSPVPYTGHRSMTMTDGR